MKIETIIKLPKNSLKKIFNRQLVYITHRFLLVLFFFFPPSTPSDSEMALVYIYFTRHIKSQTSRSQNRERGEKKKEYGR